MGRRRARFGLGRVQLGLRAELELARREPAKDGPLVAALLLGIPLLLAAPDSTWRSSTPDSSASPAVSDSAARPAVSDSAARPAVPDSAARPAVSDSVVRASIADSASRALASDSLHAVSSPTPVPPAAPRDSVPAPARVVRSFPPVEVRARLHDLRSSETVHAIAEEATGGFPVDDLADVLALQPGVVADAEGIHVRGGRAGETTVTLDGLTLHEPFERHAMDVPLLALRSAELVSGAPEAQYAAGLAGVLRLRTLDPTARPTAEWRWQSDARTGTHYDRGSLAVTTPLRVFGLGTVAAGDALLDD